MTRTSEGSLASWQRGAVDGRGSFLGLLPVLDGWHAEATAVKNLGRHSVITSLQRIVPHSWWYKQDQCFVIYRIIIHYTILPYTIITGELRCLPPLASLVSYATAAIDDYQTHHSCRVSLYKLI